MGSPIVRLVSNKAVRIIALVVCAAMGIGIVRSVYTLWQKRGTLGERQQVLNELTVKNKQLQEDLREATSPAFIEKAARDKLGLVKEGETVVIMDKTISVSGTDSENPKDLPPWKQWWKLFF